MLKIYGSRLCRDCVDCLHDLDREGIEYQFLDFAEQLVYLKEFLQIREELPVFSDVKKTGAIGIPCIQEEDGTINLDWSKYVGQAKA